MSVHEKSWVDVGALEDIPPRGSRLVRSPAGNIALFRTAAGAVYALDDRCPHKGGPLSEGIVHDDAVTCPLHNWVIHLATGQARGPDQGCTKVISVKLKDGRILIAAEALTRNGA